MYTDANGHNKQESCCLGCLSKLQETTDHFLHGDYIPQLLYNVVLLMLHMVNVRHSVILSAYNHTRAFY